MNIFELPVHPQADIFPMLPEGEMYELMEDIRDNGLINPVVIGDYEGKPHIIDGRNRREACKMAGIEPTTKALNGEDLTAYIASANLNRRHMTKSQLAMAMAMLYPEPEKGGRGRKGQTQYDRFSRDYLTKARKVLSHSQPLSEKVLIGSEFLKRAYELVIEDMKVMESEEEGMKRLREVHPDLADQVDSGTLTYVEAKAVDDQRIEQARKEAKATAITLRDLRDAMTLFASDKNRSWLSVYVLNCGDDFKEHTSLELMEVVSDMKKSFPYVKKFIKSIS